MKKFRVVVKGDDGRKHTRHVRALEREHASEQAKTILAVLCGGQGVVREVVELGGR